VTEELLEDPFEVPLGPDVISFHALLWDHLVFVGCGPEAAPSFSSRDEVSRALSPYCPFLGARSPLAFLSRIVISRQQDLVSRLGALAYSRA